MEERLFLEVGEAKEIGWEMGKLEISKKLLGKGLGAEEVSELTRLTIDRLLTV